MSHPVEDAEAELVRDRRKAGRKAVAGMPLEAAREQDGRYSAMEEVFLQLHILLTGDLGCKGAECMATCQHL